MQSTGPDRNAISTIQALAALRALYLVSGAAAQLGKNGLQIEDIQWEALAQAARDANNALQAQNHLRSDAIAAFRNHQRGRNCVVVRAGDHVIDRTGLRRDTCHEICAP